MTLDSSFLDWFMGLPMSAAMGVAAGYGLIMLFKWLLDVIAAKAKENPEGILRNDLMEAHREVRKEVQELRKELNEAYEKMRALSVELHRIRENLAGLKVDLHHFKTEYPDSEGMLGTIIERLDSVHYDRNDLSVG